MNKILLILLSALATMSLRITPMFARKAEKLPKKVRKAMYLLPVSSLGALIFPLALTDFSSSWYASLAGVLVAFIFGYKKISMVISIFASLIVTTLILLI